MPRRNRVEMTGIAGHHDQNAIANLVGRAGDPRVVIDIHCAAARGGVRTTHPRAYVERHPSAMRLPAAHHFLHGPYTGATAMRFSTLATPGAIHAARDASCRSAHERTVPLSVTWEPSASTTMRFASISALRLKASSIFFFTSVGATWGLIFTRLAIPFTPLMARTARSARSRS